METVLPELIEAIAQQLPKVDKAFFSLISIYFNKIIQRKYSLLASCVIDNSCRNLQLIKSWGNNWNKYECTSLGDSPSFVIFEAERPFFTLDQIDWVGYSVGYNNNPFLDQFSKALRDRHSSGTSSEKKSIPCGNQRNRFYPAVINGAVDSNNLEIMRKFLMTSELVRHLIQYATARRRRISFGDYAT